MRGIPMSPEQIKGGNCGRRELMDFQRREIEIRGSNSGAQKRSGYLDICELKRRIERNEIDLIPLGMRLGWPKEVEDRIAVVERKDGAESEDEGHGGIWSDRSSEGNRKSNPVLLDLWKMARNWEVSMDVETGVSQHPRVEPSCEIHVGNNTRTLGRMSAMS